MHCFVSKDARSSAPWPPPHIQTHTYTQLNTFCTPCQIARPNFLKPASSSSSSFWFLMLCCYLSIPPEPFIWQSHKHRASDFIISRQNDCQLSGYISYLSKSSSITLLIFSFVCVRSAVKWLRASQLSTTWVCSSVPVTMFPTALRAAVWMQRRNVSINILKYMYSKACTSGASWYLNFDLLMTEQRYQMWDNAGVDDHLYLLVPSIGQIRQSPHRVDQDLQETKNNRLTQQHILQRYSANSLQKSDHMIHSRWHRCGWSAHREQAGSGERKHTGAGFLCFYCIFKRH